MNFDPPSIIYWSCTWDQALCWLSLGFRDQWGKLPAHKLTSCSQATSCPQTYFLSTNLNPIYNYFLYTNLLPIHQLPCGKGRWEGSKQWLPGEPGQGISGREDTWRWASALNRKGLQFLGKHENWGRGGVYRGKWELCLLLENRWKLDAQREAVRAQEAEGTPWRSNVRVTIIIEIIVTGENDFSKGEGEM